ncbi:MAG: PQQ-binding-like beta-propeller repeat protein [Planctomycetota bacterium]
MPWLPEQLSKTPNVLWELPLARSGLGGISATERYVVFGDRDLDDFRDVYRCLDAQTGQTLWEVKRLAIAALDYGNSPRATPLIEGDRVYFCGAMGHVLCMNLANGTVIWETNLLERFKPKNDLPWGYCASPLIVDGMLIVNPGAADASLVAFDALSGVIKWRSKGRAPGYGSLAVATLGGKRQIVGHDTVSLGGWDLESGERLWSITPEFDGDFNVPTPLFYRDQLLVVTENNGARLFDFSDDGKIVEQPVASNRRLRPDMSTPVIVGNRLFCVNAFLYCLDIDNQLAESWRLRDKSFGDYAAMFWNDDRILIVANGELILLGTDGSDKILSRLRLFPENLPIYSHPAIVGKRMYIRGETKLLCIEL